MFGTYCPKSVCWSHDPDASPRLQAISTDDKSMASQGMHPQPGTPTLRLAGEGPIHEIKDAPQGDMDLGESEPPIPRTLRETLSDEELSMLLDEPPTYERRQHP